MHPAPLPDTAGPPGTIADFTVLGPLGRSGSFVLATPPARLVDAGPQVVLKVYPADAATDEHHAFDRVAAALRAIAAVRSSFLVRLLEVGRNDGLIYYAMEHLPGGSLAAPASQLTFAEVLRAVSCAARGAHDLHEQGIAHRNIHPAGVILHAEGARLSDPGLATYLNPGMTLTGRLGTPHVAFMSPELLRGQEPTRASDLYSLGATLHYAASGQTLHPHVDATDPSAGLSSIMSSAPTIDPGLPAPIAQIVQQCIDPAHQDRPKTAGDLADRLDALWKR
ncbi:protein kinase [Blastococcus sp. Marseille-P5729]|uniref:protein kinase domain-containing protein n=1 Tax=Blastococcus sp. Marseille-P5729 TaxID=2086582 RepID=UPI000D0FFE32|nr:protein kinase [Blastococcus sp. Marseille-P5729]